MQASIDAVFNPSAQLLLLGFYFTLLICLSAYGAHRCYLLYLYTRYRARETPPGGAPEDLPYVTVQLPIYNELYVVERLIDAAARLDYPAERLEIQVLDDSTDETRQVAARAVARWSARGITIRRLPRVVRAGYKAGALAAGLRCARGDAIAIFDADFLPPRDFLRRAIPALGQPRVGMVQARWGHVNRDYSWLTRVQALLLDAHFVLEHGARHRAGCFFNFNGTAGVWRRQAIEDAGGWQDDTLTEDLDLSYRAQLAGWRFVFLPELVAPAEVPVEMTAFKLQQQRWATGSIQTCLKVLPDVLRSSIRRRLKLEALFHLTANLNYPLLLLAAVLMVPALFVRAPGGAPSFLAFDLPLFCAAALSMVNFYAVSQRAVRRDWLSQLKWVPLAIAVGFGLSVNNTRAVLGALRGGRPGFRRTAKYGVVDRSDEWRAKRYRQTRAGQPFVELGLGLYFAVGAIGAVAGGPGAAGAEPCGVRVGFLFAVAD
ncbi:MAG: glycosyltransferase family 2 protein, partial [Acidobacteria bacterium]|nr:glycosyltransferase family 2 protein [Acidobacteriota bacterium]